MTPLQTSASSSSCSSYSYPSSYYYYSYSSSSSSAKTEFPALELMMIASAHYELMIPVILANFSRMVFIEWYCFSLISATKKDTWTSSPSMTLLKSRLLSWLSLSSSLSGLEPWLLALEAFLFCWFLSFLESFELFGFFLFVYWSTCC